MKHRSAHLTELGSILKSEYSGKDLRIRGLWRDLETMPLNEPVLTYCGSSAFLERALKMSSVGAIITTRAIASKFGSLKKNNIPIFFSPDPETSFFELHQYLYEKSQFYNDFEFKSKIGSSSKIHSSVVIEDGVIIGKGVCIDPGVVIKKGSRIGNQVRIKANTVIGGDGFEVKRIYGELRVVRHAGGVLIADNVEIGSNCGIDKALFEGVTEIAGNVKIDNLTQIAHNCYVGEDTVICANVNVAGAVRIGKNCYLAPGVNIRNSLIINDRGFIGMSALVTRNVPSGETWAGIPAKLFKRK